MNISLLSITMDKKTLNKCTLVRHNIMYSIHQVKERKHLGKWSVGLVKLYRMLFFSC